MNSKHYITTPLYYVNARPHIGHTYTTILADTVARFYRQRGEPTVFLTGTDEHGEKIAQIAAEQKRDPAEFVEEVAKDYESTWKKIGLTPDIFYRTTDSHHKKAVQFALQKIKDQGEIEFREYEGSYCLGCERFLKDSDLTPEGLCPDHMKKPELRKEANYFFLMSRYQKRLVDYYQANPSAIQPAHYRNEILSFLEQPLEDLCISRPKTRLTWGIELPFDSKYVCYVWFDALLNYLVATGWPGDLTSDAATAKKWDEELWKSATHFMAKDIIKTHAVYWPTMLMALGVPLYQGIVAHGYWLSQGTKMSKSLGNVVRPLEVHEKFGIESLRFFLLKEMSFGLDSSFTWETYITATNAYLANGIGNLTSRVLTLCQKGFPGSFSESDLNPGDRALLTLADQLPAAFDSQFREYKYHLALKTWSELVTACDGYVNENKPWALAKDPAQAGRLAVVLGVCMNVLKTLAIMIQPVMPEASGKILAAMGCDPQPVLKPSGIQTEFRLGAEVPRLFGRINMADFNPPAN